MAGRVDLNLPPRLIESARAAQYANRAALDARALDQKIEERTAVRYGSIQRAAAQGAQPLTGLGGGTSQLQASPARQAGGILEFNRKPAPRIRLPRRRTQEGVTLGSLFLLATTRRYETGWRNWTYFFGSIDGQKWITIQESVRFSGGAIRPQEYVSWLTFPAGGSDQVLLIRKYQAEPIGGAEIAPISEAAYLVKPDDIINLSVSGIISIMNQYTQIQPDLGYILNQQGARVRFSPKGSYTAFLPILYPSLTMVIEEYRQYTGNPSASIPLIEIDRSSVGSTVNIDGSTSYPAILETHGVITNIELSGDFLPLPPIVTPETTDLTELELISPVNLPPLFQQELALGATIDQSFSVSGLPGRLYAYDYHGGTYCRDRLQALGITLP